MMGSGKTVTGKALAELFKKNFTDLDELLEKKRGKSIAAIFGTEGEDLFREEESQILKETAGLREQVFSTGGGVVTREANVALMKASGTVIYLKTSLEWLWKRVKDHSHRPLLKSKDPRQRLGEILRAREPLYVSAAHFSVETDAKTAKQVALEIAEMLELHESSSC